MAIGGAYKLRMTGCPQVANMRCVITVRARPELALHDRVQVPDGREGDVAGFYRLEDELVLVSFSAYDAAKFRASDVELLKVKPEAPGNGAAPESN
jgi:hypothetical protein